MHPSYLRYWNGSDWVGPPQAYASPYAPEPRGPVLLTAAGERFELSGWWRRAGGFILDALIVGVPFALFEVVLGLIFYSSASGFLSFGSQHPVLAGPALRLALSVASTGVTFAYAVWFIGRRRQTIGMQAVGITVIDPSGRALTDRQVWLRALYRVLFIDVAGLVVAAVTLHRDANQVRPASVAVSGLVSLVPAALYLLVYLWPLGSERNQTLIDRAAGSVVVRGDPLGPGAVQVPIATPVPNRPPPVGPAPQAPAPAYPAPAYPAPVAPPAASPGPGSSRS